MTSLNGIVFWLYPFVLVGWILCLPSCLVMTFFWVCSQDVTLFSWISTKNYWILQGQERVHAVLFTSGADYNGSTGTDETVTCWAGQNTFLVPLSDFPPCGFSLGTPFLFSSGRPYLATPFAWLSSLVSLTPFPSFFFPCWGGGGIVSALLFSRNCCPIEFF